MLEPLEKCTSQDTETKATEWQALNPMDRSVAGLIENSIAAHRDAIKAINDKVSSPSQTPDPLET